MTTLLEEIAQRRANETVYTVISATIEKLAVEMAKDILADPAFREELKLLARGAFATSLRQLHATPSKKQKKARQP